MTIKQSEIYNYLDSKGLKHSNIGFTYLQTSIELGIDDPGIVRRISDLYEKIAEIYCTSKPSIAGAIRCSILHLKQTNKEFISRAVEVVKQNIEEKTDTFADNH
jgi:hypothetical protein